MKPAHPWLVALLWASTCATPPIRADGEAWCWGWWDLSRKTPKQRDEASRRPQQVGW